MTEQEQFQAIQQQLQKLDFPVSRVTKGTLGLPTDTLVAELDEDEKQRARQLVISFFPADDDLADSRFLQLYTVLPLELPTAALADASCLLHRINSRAPLGHFGLTDEDKIQFRYVWAISASAPLSAGQIEDVLDMCIFTQDLFYDLFLDLEAGRPLAEFEQIFARFTQ